ncbi:hypothetical protein FCM35_KLT14474 [Carex littledalei]|uniref:Uncharacterized protein n=1 Tax=Carex littledalei TaxID=544730 RepID=A0A833UZQ7_9POAL|nr:hypothetical protein FCM35_KLT14474 [Carex littledalei]
MRLISTGTFSLIMPKTLALIAVQRQSAASRSTNPSIREQHGTTGGLPTWALIKLSTSAHTPSLSALIGQVVPPPGEGGLGALGAGGGGHGAGGGGDLGTGGGVEQVPQHVANVKKRRLRVRKSAMVEETFGAMFLLGFDVCTMQ